MRKFLALVLALVMTMSLVTVSAGAATDFTDDAKIVNTEAVEVLNAMGVLGGYDDGSFRPQATLTRGAGAKLIAYLMLGQAKADKLTATYTVFEDVTDTVGLAPYIEWAATQGVLGGYGDGNFGPYNPLTEYAFGKMLLGALGYSAEEEGYTGAGWQKNVYRDANYAGIYDGTESYGACTRDTAARMMLGALKANVVAYGTATVGNINNNTGVNGAIYWNGQLIGTGGWNVEGRIETDSALWSFYPGLTYTALCADVWGRPGHRWEYETKDVEFDKFYMDAPVNTYTTVVDECAILVDFGVSKTEKDKLDIQYVVNGDAEAVSVNESHANCGAKHGGQGTLTQLFEVDIVTQVGNREVTTTHYVVTSIDTYLSYVESVTTTAHKSQGITTLSQYKNAAANNVVGDETDKATVVIDDSIGYAKKDYVLINVAADTTTAPLVYLPQNNQGASIGFGVDSENYYVDNNTNDYVAVVGAPTVIAAGKFSGVAFDQTLATVNGVQTPVAKHYELSASNLLFANIGKYDFFVDQYGNIIGDKALENAFTYGVITDLQFEQASLGETSWADVALVGTDAAKNVIKMYQYGGTKVTEDLDPNAANGKVSRYNSYNDEYYYYETATSNLGVVRVYELATGGYNLVSVDDNHQVLDGTATITKGDATLNRNTNGATTAIADNDTIFVVKTVGADGTAVYTNYVGIDAVPTMAKVSFVAVYETEVAAEFVYVDATKGYFKDNTKMAVITNADLTYSEDGATYTYKAWIEGVETPVVVSKNAINAATLFGGAEGLYELRFNADGIVTEVALKAKLETTDVTFSGNQGADAQGAATGWFYDTVEAVSTNVTVKFANDVNGYSITGAKVYKILFTENVLNNTSVWDNAAGDKLTGTAVAATDAIAANAQVIYKLNTAGTAVDTIYVLAESFN